MSFVEIYESFFDFEWFLVALRLGNIFIRILRSENISILGGRACHQRALKTFQTWVTGSISCLNSNHQSHHIIVYILIYHICTETWSNSHYHKSTFTYINHNILSLETKWKTRILFQEIGICHIIWPIFLPSKKLNPCHLRFGTPNQNVLNLNFTVVSKKLFPQCSQNDVFCFDQYFVSCTLIVRICTLRRVKCIKKTLFLKHKAINVNWRQNEPNVGFDINHCWSQLTLVTK